MRRSSHSQRGVAILVVLVLMSVMLLGGLALARMTEIGAMATGNLIYRDTALQASEVGLNDVFAQIGAILNEDTADGHWYFPIIQASDVHGLPVVDWSLTPEVVVGQYSVRYVAERVCEGALPLTDPLRQCLVKQMAQLGSADASKEALDPPNAKQYRVTIRVTGPKDSQTWVQALITKG